MTFNTVRVNPDHLSHGKLSRIRCKTLCRKYTAGVVQ